MMRGCVEYSILRAFVCTDIVTVFFRCAKVVPKVMSNV